MTSEALQKARTYERGQAAAIPPEARPAFHLTAPVGWMNDPNGFSLYGGRYHIFFQYHPYTTQWGPMHWGHAVSTDLLHWQYLPAALAPDTPYDSFGCFSGSALELPSGEQLLMYTGVRSEYAPDGTRTDYQTQCLATGDGVDYSKYPDNPVLGPAGNPAGFSANDFRDPKLFPRPEGGYAAVTVSRRPEGCAVLLHESDDAYRWRFRSVLACCDTAQDVMWECPDLFSLGGTDILLVSTQDLSPAGLSYEKGFGALFYTGRFDAAAGTFTSAAVQAADCGLDFYAPQTLLTPDGRRVMIGWLQNWGTCAPAPEAKWYGQLSLPRELTLRDGRVYQNPVQELEACRRDPVRYENLLLDGELSLPGVEGRLLDVTITLRPAGAAGYEAFCLTFAGGGGSACRLSYRPGASLLRLNREGPGTAAAGLNGRECPVPDRGGALTLRLVLDRCSAEVFVNGGEQVLSLAFEQNPAASGLRFASEGAVRLDVEKYTLAL